MKQSRLVDVDVITFSVRGQPTPGFIARDKVPAAQDGESRAVAGRAQAVIVSYADPNRFAELSDRV
jgi:hypothetical protein